MTRVAIMERRAVYRQRVLKTGVIILGEKAPKLECAIRNVSDSGATLQMSTTVGIPGNFDVIVDGTKRRCRSQWRTDTLLGVKFESEN